MRSDDGEASFGIGIDLEGEDLIFQVKNAIHSADCDSQHRYPRDGSLRWKRNVELSNIRIPA